MCKRTNPVAADVYPNAQVAGDCKRIQCDGKGNEILADDPEDVPYDGNECTEDSCANGIPTNPALPGETCGTSNLPLSCNSDGYCAGCASPNDCGLPNNPCATFACDNAICSRTPRNVGLVISNPVVGDCQALICTSTGNAIEAFVPTDALQDEDPCTVELCNSDGTFYSTAAPDGTKCGDCLICIGGTCSPCDSATLDCYQNACVPKPIPCKTADDCTTGYCVDGFCCESECKSPCMACSNEKTGIPSGYCAPIKNGEDPDEECSAEDVCRNGSCGCKNAMKDGNEGGVDCGGACVECTGKWNCGGVSTCEGIGTDEKCCWPICDFCADESAECKALQGQTCALGAKARELSVGTTNAGCFLDSRACRYVTCKCE